MKRGEITTQQIVIIIVLIASFSVLLLFLFRTDFKEITSEQLCRNSVILSSKSRADSLECQTQYLCLSSGEICENLKSAEIVKVNEQERVENVAELMKSCWYQYGDGEYDFLSGYTSVSSKQCGICSEFILSEVTGFKEGLESYLNSKEVPGTKATYAQHLGFNVLTLPEFEQGKIYAIVFEADVENPTFPGERFVPSLRIVPVDDLKDEGCDSFFSLA